MPGRMKAGPEGKGPMTGRKWEIARMEVITHLNQMKELFGFARGLKCKVPEEVVEEDREGEACKICPDREEEEGMRIT